MSGLEAIGAGSLDRVQDPRAGSPQKSVAGEKAGGGFKEFLEDAVGSANRLQNEADGVVKKLATGEIDDVHQVMLAMNRADLSFRMMLEVRNRLMEAYQEVMRTQV